MTWIDALSPGWLNEWSFRQQTPVEAVSTGLPSLDYVCGDDGGKVGLARGWFVTLGGNPGHGKSLLALNLAVNFLKGGRSVAFISLEMSPAQLSTRLYAIATGIKVDNLERGDHFQPGDLKARVAGLGKNFASFIVNDEPLTSIGEVMDYLHSANEAGFRVIMLDYLQLVGTGDEDGVYQQVSTIATSVRQFAHKNQVLVIGLSQYNRRTSADTSGRPAPQSLHGGMALEANSDVVLLLDHSRYSRDQLRPNLARTWLIVGKNRHGAQVDIPILWDYTCLRVREAMPDEEHLWPGTDRR